MIITKVLLGLVATALALSLIVVSLLFTWDDPLHIFFPTDKYLIDTLNGNKTTLEQIVTTERREKAYNFYKDPKIKETLSTIHHGLTAVVVDEPDSNGSGKEHLSFNFARGGTLERAWSKGLDYFDGLDQNASIKANLDAVKNLPPDDYYKPVDSHWAIRYTVSEGVSDSDSSPIWLVMIIWIFVLVGVITLLLRRLGVFTH